MIQGEMNKYLISDINNEGEGIVRVGDERLVVFVPDALPGEEVSCRLIRVKKNYAIAKVITRHNNSPERTQPVCSVFGSCGGCQLQHINYSAQLRIKTKTVFDALKRIGGVDEPQVNDCVASPSEWGYRNKASLPVQNTIRDKMTAGFYRRRSHDIIPFVSCPVLLPGLTDNIKSILNDLRESSFHGCNESDKGNVTNFIRHLVFRDAKFTGEKLCGVIGNRDLKKMEVERLKLIGEANSGSLNGLIYNKNSSTGNFIWGDKFSCLHGDSIMHERLGNFDFEFEISSFFQINSEQALNLYKCAAEFALADSPKKILELYSGVGSLTAFLAMGAEQVTAVESWEPAAKYMVRNAEINGLNNVTGHIGRAEDIAIDLADNYDAIVLDPPRTGCDKEVLEAILRILPNRIVYVSCNPSTLARDIKILTAAEYQISQVQPFDMFPQTGHVECVLLLVRKQTRIAGGIL